MTDLANKMDVFIITNGRSTFEYCLNSLANQFGVTFNLSVIRDMQWLDANNKIVDDCTSPFFMRIDDDMILHSRAVEFVWSCISRQSKKIALRGWRLWEPWSDKKCKGLKVYNHSIVRKVGFRLTKNGKLDKMFVKDIKQYGFKNSWTQDTLAIHSCGTYDENIDYAKKRNEQKGKNFKSEMEWIKKQITQCNMTIQQQSQLSGKFLEKLNKKEKTKFNVFLNG